MNELEKKIEEAATKYANNCSVGTSNQYTKITFTHGATSQEAKNYWQKGTYTEEEVLALFENWLNTKINEELMAISGELDCLEGVTFSDWFEQNKKK